MPRFLDYFTYESREIQKEEGGNIFTKVTFLSPVGKYQPGDKVDAIYINLNFLIWQDNELVEDVTIPCWIHH